MKSILLSIRPELVAKILNGEKTIEIRKKFPKDYVGWVYIYCTKGKESLYYDAFSDYPDYCLIKADMGKAKLNGKVVARFWCDKVEDIYVEEWDADYGWEQYALETKEISHDKLAKKSCLTEEQLWEYLDVDLDDYYPDVVGYAIHISKLEVFEKPRELKEFNTKKVYQPKTKPIVFVRPLKKAPQNFVYIESEE